MAPDTSAIFDAETEQISRASEIMNQETKRLEGSTETVVPETQTQHPRLLLSNRAKIQHSIEESKQKDESEKVVNNKPSPLKPQTTKEVIPTEFEMELRDIAESPSILSLKHRSQRYSQEFSESPSILSGNKCSKKINADTHVCGDSDTLSMFKIEKQSRDRLSTSSNDLEINKDLDLHRDQNLETTRLKRYSSANDSMNECKENTPYNENKVTNLDMNNGQPEDDSRNKEVDTTTYQAKIEAVKSKILNMNKQTNKWGIEITSDIASHISRSGSLKQGSIQTFLKPKSELKPNQKRRKRATGDDIDDEMQQAIELSKLEAEQTYIEDMDYSLPCTSNQANNRMVYDSDYEADPRNDDKTPYMNVMDSFNCVPDTMMLRQENERGEKPKFKYVRSPIRKKADRLKLLQGHDCKECRDFYKGDNLTESQLNELLNKCSKHRSKEPPLQQSPQIRWNLEIEEDGPNDKTQISSPFKTRERRKLLRKL